MTKAFDLYKKMDAYLIGRLNDLYLWAFDWTGVFIGTISFLFGAMQVAIMINGDHNIMAGFMLIVVLINAGSRYYFQALNRHEAYNAGAIVIERAIWRHYFIWLNVTFIPVDLYLGRTLSFLNDTIMILLFYLWCCKIRERQKKEFKLPQLAMQKGAS